jgi:hypothetical protein
MTLNKAQVNEQISPQTTSFKKKWEQQKKHLLLVIAGFCLLFWWLGSQGKVSWVPAVGNWLPLIGGLALVGEQLVKLIS